MKASLAALMFVLAAMVLAAATFVSYEALIEAYGSGPPYYSRTTNMEKWTDPLQDVALLYLAALTLAVALTWIGARMARKLK